MLIRPASPADLDDLLRLEAGFSTDRLTRASFRHLLRRGHADVLVCEDAGKMLGNAVVLYRRGSRNARLYSLIVDPTRRRSGIAAILLRAVEAAAHRQGCTTVSLEVREDNTGALRLYEAGGYRRVRRIDDYYADHAPALRLSRRLPAEEEPAIATKA
jgi:[ribosomal protein S18]-alanine N-acetyltransferase